RRIAGSNGGSQKGLFLMRYRWFESISLQQRVCLSAASTFEGPKPRLFARVCAAGLAPGSAETLRMFRQRPNLRQYLGMDYGSTEPLPKGGTNGDFPPQADPRGAGTKR